jgi:phosphoenolpyruvate carboxylase
VHDAQEGARIAQALTAPGDDADPAAVQHEVGIAWQTDEHFAQPSVDDEVEHVLFFLTNVIYKVVPQLYTSLESAFSQTSGDSAIVMPTRMLRFASWVGGDMDGNPNVDASTIRNTLNHHRMRILELYETELHDVFEHLSHSRHYVTPSHALVARLTLYTESNAERIEEVDDAAPQRYLDMPYRNYLWQLWRRIKVTHNASHNRYTTAEQFVDDLEILHDSLCGHGGTGAPLVLDLIRRIGTFGFHLATLDVRQDSAVHRDALGEALGRENFSSLPADERLQLLHDALTAPIDVRPVVPHTKERDTARRLERSLNVMRAVLEVAAATAQAQAQLVLTSLALHNTLMMSLPCHAMPYLARAAGLCDDNDDVPLDAAPCSRSSMTWSAPGELSLHCLLIRYTLNTLTVVLISSWSCSAIPTAARIPASPHHAGPYTPRKKTSLQRSVQTQSEVRST